MSTLLLAEPLPRREGGSVLRDSSGGAAGAGGSGPTGAPGEVKPEAEALGEAPSPSRSGAGCVGSGRTRTAFIVCGLCSRSGARGVL